MWAAAGKQKGLSQLRKQKGLSQLRKTKELFIAAQLKCK